MDDSDAAADGDDDDINVDMLLEDDLFAGTDDLLTSTDDDTDDLADLTILDDEEIEE